MSSCANCSLALSSVERSTLPVNTRAAALQVREVELDLRIRGVGDEEEVLRALIVASQERRRSQPVLGGGWQHGLGWPRS